MNGEKTLSDIVGQGAAWLAARDAVDRSASELVTLLDRCAPRHIAFTACGSPLLLSDAGVSTWAAHSPSRWFLSAHPASEILQRPTTVLPYPADTLLVAISRSGATTEVIGAIEAFRNVGGRHVLAITCRSDSELPLIADLTVSIDEGFESQIAQTKSFSSMLIAVEAIGRLLGGARGWSPDELRSHAADAQGASAGFVDALDASGALAALQRIDLLGSGDQHGVAREAVLKLTELALVDSSAYTFHEYRHGPKAMVDEQTVVLGLLDLVTHDAEQEVLTEMAALGGKVAALARPDGAPLAWFMPALQLLAHRIAVLKGLDPDSPRHLDAVVRLDAATAGGGR